MRFSRAASPPAAAPDTPAAGRPTTLPARVRAAARRTGGLPWRERVALLLADLSHFPWKTTVATLRERFREDQLGLTASSLTFTTVLALVPFVTVALAVFTAFPMFNQVQEVLQRWLVQSLVPDAIARQVLGYLTQFASQASRLGFAGLTLLLITAIALILTIDRTLNGIWRVRKPRPLAQRVLIYWAAITLGPILMGLSLALTSYIVTSSRGLVGPMPGGLVFGLNWLEFVLLASGVTALFRYVPNTYVQWSHAWVGGLFVAVCMEIAKKVLGIYLGLVPSYSAVYGAFATFPILLVWLYVAWVILLLGAVITAYLPSLLRGVARRGGTPGWQFQLAVEVLQQLHAARKLPEHGLHLAELVGRLEVDPLQLVPVMETLTTLDWVAKLDEPEGVAGRAGDARFVLLADPGSTPLEPLMQRLLLPDAPSLGGMRRQARWQGLLLRDAL